MPARTPNPERIAKAWALIEEARAMGECHGQQINHRRALLSKAWSWVADIPRRRPAQSGYDLEQVDRIWKEIKAMQ